MKKLLIWLLFQADVWGSILAGKLVRWTGKSAYEIHPKHFLNRAWQRWYLPEVQTEDVVLDVGCANGMHTIACARQARRVCGFDYSAKQLAVAAGKAKEEGVANVHFCRGDVEMNWPYADGSFDLVVFLDVLEHLHCRDEAMAEVRRMLRPGGRLLLSIPQRDTSWKRLRESMGLPAYADPDHKHEYTRAEVEAMVAGLGFVVESLDVTVLDTPLAGWIDLVGGLSLPLYRRLAQWKRDEAVRRPLEATGFRIAARKVG